MDKITILGVVVGFLVSCAAGGLVWYAQYRWNKRVLKKKFGGLSGIYKGYEFKQDQWELKEEPVSKAEIKYERDNILSITVTHNLETDTPLTWIGFIAMEVERYGTLSFHYIKGLQEGQLRFGFKRCIVSPKGGQVLLIGDKTEGYGNEVLRRDKVK